jgi:UDP-N-acetylmuramoylalanine--D-glutamate ligase
MIAESNGVRFYNDSKATNTHALRSALQAMPESASGPKNIWLIAGGQSKGLDFRKVVQELERRVKGVFLIGQTAAEIRHAWEGFVTCNLADNLVEAVAEAGRNAVPGDVVLLSPACASFDMFDSYQHRGEMYRGAVAQWVDTMGGN